MNNDDELDRAVAAMRELDGGDPTPQLKGATVGALHQAQRPSHAWSGRASMAWALAAAVALAACGFAAFTLLPHDSTQGGVHSPAQANRAGPSQSPAPSTQHATPEPVIPAVPPGHNQTNLANALPNPPPSPDNGPVAVAAARWSIAGKVMFEGTVPAPAPIDMSAAPDCARHHPAGTFDESFVVSRGRLANVVVSVRPTEGQELPAAPAPAGPALLDQKGCRYAPHVLAMRVGQPIVVSNSDPLLHNVHALTMDNPAFNFGQPTIDRGRNLGPMKAAEVFKVKCDFHPWMLAYVHVFDHPYYAVTGGDGTFAIPAGLPDGKYTLVAWHEKLGQRELAVEVKGGRAEGADFLFRAE